MEPFDSFDEFDTPKTKWVCKYEPRPKEEIEKLAKAEEEQSSMPKSKKKTKTK